MEVRAASAQREVIVAWPVERVRRTEVQVVMSVTINGGIAVSANELHLPVRTWNAARLRAAHSHAAKHRVGHVFSRRPLHNERRASGDGAALVHAREVERQHTRRSNKARCRAVERHGRGTLHHVAAHSHVKRQTQRVPATVLVERAASKLHGVLAWSPAQVERGAVDAGGGEASEQAEGNAVVGVVAQGGHRTVIVGEVARIFAGDESDVADAYVGGVSRTCYGAGLIVVVLKCAIVVPAADGTVVIVPDGGHDGSDSEVAAQGAFIVPAHDAAKVGELITNGVAGNLGCTGAVADFTAYVVVAHDAAVGVGRLPGGVDDDGGCGMAVADGGWDIAAAVADGGFHIAPALTVADVTAVVAHDAAGEISGGDAGVGEGDAPYVGTSSHAEEALMPIPVGAILVVAVVSLIDADAADGVALAIEVAIEGVVVAGDIARLVEAADGGVVVLLARGFVPSRSVAVGDVGSELEVLALVLAPPSACLTVLAIDALCQHVELILIINHVGVVFGACVHGSPVNGD